MVLPNEITDDDILRSTEAKLSKLIQDFERITGEQQQREREIQKLRLLYNVYSNGEPINIQLLGIKGMGNREETPIPTISNTSESSFDYPFGATWVKKIIAVLKHNNKVMKVSEMVSIIEKYEKDYSRKQLVGLISNTINTTMLKKGYIKIYTPEPKTKGFYYGSPLWWENDLLLKEYEPVIRKEKLWE